AVNRSAMRKRWTKVTVTVADPLNHAVSGAVVRVSGAGVKAKTGRTKKTGKITFRIKPRKKGRLTYTATKPGYAAGGLSQRASYRPVQSRHGACRARPRRLADGHADRPQRARARRLGAVDRRARRRTGPRGRDERRRAAARHREHAAGRLRARLVLR